jgi:hypothetical protein
MLIIEHCESINIDIAKKINRLVYDSDIKEYFDYGDLLFTGWNKEKLVAIEVFRMEEFEGKIIPRFIHLVLHPDIKKSKEAVKFLLEVERRILSKGYNKIWAYILNKKFHMAILAIKFGFKKREEDTESITLYKMIGV